MTGASMTRRELARTLMLAGAAAVVTSPRPVTAAVPPDWPQVVAAAKKEGKLAVNTFPGDGFGRALKVFSQAYPEIKLQHTSLHSQDFAPRILQERQANLF